MSDSTYFLYDICNLKVGDMDCMDMVKSEESLEPQDDENQSVEKLKESHLLFKKKLNLSNELIQQYNDKIKECQQVSAELETVKDNCERITQKYNSSLSKIIKLEIENDEFRQKIENFSKIVPEQQTKIAADQRHLQQLICRVQELEQKERSEKEESLKEKIKVLETDLKSAKESHKMEIKQMGIKLKSIKATDVVKNRIKKKVNISHEKSTYTGDELEPVIVRPKMFDKCTLTNDFYSIKDDPYPLFCTKCQIKFDPAPLDQILEQMSSCPTLITEVLSPPKKSVSEIGKSHASNPALSEAEWSWPEAASDNLNHHSQSLDPVERNSDISTSEFQRLEQRLSSLECKLRKKVKKEVQVRSPYCGVQFPCNCYLGPHLNLFQPETTMRSQADLLQFKNWLEDLRSRKRSRQNSIKKSNRRRMRLTKKRKLEDGTSVWNVDSVPIRNFNDLNHTNTSENDSEPTNEILRPKPLSPDFCKRKYKLASRRKDNESCLPLRRKRDKFAGLFSPVRSPSPRSQNPEENTHKNNAIYNEVRTELPEMVRVESEILSDEETMENGPIMPVLSREYETVECVSKKQNNGAATRAAKLSTKRSLVTKIRNLKKNCINSRPLVNKTVANDNIDKLINKKILGATVLMTALPNSGGLDRPIKIDENLNDTNAYCPANKHRIAHSAQKPKNDSRCKVIKNSAELSEVSFQNYSVHNNVANGTAIQNEATSDKLDNFVEKNPKTLVQIGRKNGIKDFAPINCSPLVKEPAVKYLEVEHVAKTTAIELGTENLTNDNLDTNNSAVSKDFDDKEVAPLLSCATIPRMCLGIEGVEDPCDAKQRVENTEMKEDKLTTNISSNNEKMSKNDASWRILRSKTKINKSDDEVLSKNEVTHTPESPDNNEISKSMSDIHDSSMSICTDITEEANNEVLASDKIDSAVVTRKYKKSTRIKPSPTSPIRELRSRRIILIPSTNLEGNNSISNANEETRNETAPNAVQLPSDIDTQSNEGFGPRALIKRYFIKQNQDSHRRRRVNEKLQQRRENLVLKELSKLADDQEWTKAVLVDAIERLSKFKTHTIAKCTLDFLATRAEDTEELDRTYTPPAPLLSKTQQRVLTMLVVLNRTMPNIIQLVQAGIEFRLFRLGHAPEVKVVEELSRVFTALARIQKDRERVRILCCDALYCLGLKAMLIIYVILISWPEVFPMAGSSSDPLLLCLTDAIMTQTGDTKFPKFFALKKLLTGYYNYESSGQVDNTLAKNLMIALREKRQNGLDTAIILLAKKKGPVWTHKNIIQGGLLQMIIQNAHPSVYNAFCLLGHLMRSFPVDDKKGVVKNILEQLCALMESREGSSEQQEGVATALMSLSRHKQDVVAQTLLNWEPSAPLSELTYRQLTALFDSHPPFWWNTIIRKNSMNSR